MVNIRDKSIEFTISYVRKSVTNINTEQILFATIVYEIYENGLPSRVRGDRGGENVDGMNVGVARCLNIHKEEYG